MGSTLTVGSCVSTMGKLFTPVAKQYDFVPVKGRRRCSAGKVTACRSKSNGSPSQRWDDCTSGSAPGSTLDNEYGKND